MSIHRGFWQQKIFKELKKKNVIWLAGPRRTGKTTLCQQLPDGEYFNCDLPRVQQKLSDPEVFLKSQKGLIVLDEIHQLSNAAQILKIVADEFPKLQVLATGSSTLMAGKKFQDTLTDRKRTLIFPPVLLGEVEFNSDIPLETRLLRGGCPPALLSKTLNEDFYSEWMDSFYSRDILEIFKVDKRQPFMDALKFIFQRNGGLLELSELGREVGISRPTASRYLDILEVAQALRVIRPFSQKDANELKGISKVYGFDTGFVCFSKSIQSLRESDKGLLFENLVLDELLTQFRKDQIYYWRTKSGNEIDFVIQDRGFLHGIEVKTTRKSFSSKAFAKFRSLYPRGKNIVLCGDLHRHSSSQQGELQMEFYSLEAAHELSTLLSEP